MIAIKQRPLAVPQQLLNFEAEFHMVSIRLLRISQRMAKAPVIVEHGIIGW